MAPKVLAAAPATVNAPRAAKPRLTPAGESNGDFKSQLATNRPGLKQTTPVKPRSSPVSDTSGQPNTAAGKPPVQNASKGTNGATGATGASGAQIGQVIEPIEPSEQADAIVAAAVSLQVAPILVEPVVPASTEGNVETAAPSPREVGEGAVPSEHATKTDETVTFRRTVIQAAGHATTERFNVPPFDRGLSRSPTPLPRAEARPIAPGSTANDTTQKVPAVMLPPVEPTDKTSKSAPAPIITETEDETVPSRVVAQIEPNDRVAKAKAKQTASDPRLSSADASLRSDSTKTADARPEHVGAARKNTTSMDTPVRIEIRSGNGDATAASLGRFLISGTNDASSLTANAGSGTESISLTDVAPAHSIGRTASPTSAAPAQTVHQLLTAGEATTDVIGAAAKVLSATSTTGRQQVTLQLDPPELGHLRLEIRMNQQAMTLRVAAESHAVARLIENRLPELREALATHGIRVDRSDIVVNPPSSSESSGQQNQDGHRGAPQSHDGRPSHSDTQQGSAGHERSGAAGQDEQLAHHDPSGNEPANAPISEGWVNWQDGNETSPTAELWLDLVA